jgi:hypothetical protein
MSIFLKELRHLARLAAGWLTRPRRTPLGRRGTGASVTTP